MISIILVNYNSSAYTINCVESIIKSFSGKTDYEIIIVDNNSNEKEKEILRNLRINESVKILYSNENLGFAKANNLAVKNIVKKEIIWFLNNDTLVNKNLIQIIEKNLPNKKEVLYFDTYDFDNKFNSNGMHCINLLFGNVNIRNKEFPFDTNYICGASLIIRYDENMPLWDEKYFLYYEDADYSMQLIESGYTFIYLKGCYFNHRIFASTGKMSGVNIVRQRSQLIFMKKWGKCYPIFYFVRICYLFFKGNIEGMKMMQQCERKISY